MTSFYDDNYGWWDEEDGIEFYWEVAKRSVWKKCVDCGRRVKILPEYECCSPCADKREGGYGY